MDSLPDEILQYIFFHIDDFSKLLFVSLVNRRWRSCIVDDVYFLNRWFSRSLDRFRQTSLGKRVHHKIKMTHISGINRSLFPINLQSSECCLLPSTGSQYLPDHQNSTWRCYSLSSFSSSRSFSFWLFLPSRSIVRISTIHWSVNDVLARLLSHEVYHTDNGEQITIDNRWIHMVWTKTDEKSSYRIWIDERRISKFKFYEISREYTRRRPWKTKLLIRYFPDESSSVELIKCRIADVTAFNRSLTSVEIRASYQQQTSTNRVQVGTYINKNKIHQTNHFKWLPNKIIVLFLFSMSGIFLVYKFLRSKIK
jgi:hypothetical protein